MGYEMESSGALRLTLVNSDGEPLNTTAEVRLTNQTVKDDRSITVPTDKPILISGLRAFPYGLYKVDVKPANFALQSRLVIIQPKDPTEICLVFRGPKDLAASSFTVPDTLTEAALTERVRSTLRGPNVTDEVEAIVWQDAGDEVIAHLSSLQIRLVPPAAFAAIDLESDQTGRGTLIIRFVFGNDKDPAGLFAVTDEIVHGHPQLSARWGPIFRDLIWSLLTRLSRDHAAERALAPLQLSIVDGTMQFHASPSIPLPERVKQFLNPSGKPARQPGGKDS